MPKIKVTHLWFSSTFMTPGTWKFTKIRHFDYLQRSIFQTFWKPDFGARFLFIELDTSNFGYLLIFWFCWTVQSLRKTGQYLHYTFYKGPPFDVFCLCNLPKIQRGDPCKMCNINVVQSFSIFAQFSKIKK